MKRTQRLILALCLGVVALLPGVCRADQAATRKGRDFALLIGTNIYNDFYYPTLTHPINDVKTVSSFLKREYGFDVTVLENPSKSNIVAAINDLLNQNFTDDDQLLIYIAGHADFNDRLGAGELICKDSMHNLKPERTNFPFTTLVRNIAQIRCRHVLLMLDTAYGGTITDSFKHPRSDPKQSLDQVLGTTGRLKTRLAIGSGDKARMPDPAGTHSHYCYRFLEALEKGTAKGFLRMSDLLPIMMTAKPQPVFGPLPGNDGGSDFLFIRK